MGMDLFVKTAGKFLSYIEQYAIKHKINHIYFLGDMFQIKTKVDSMDFIFIRNIIRSWKNKFKLYFLIGNHDMPLPDSTDGSIMHAFDEYGRVVKDYEYFDLSDDLRLHFMSYIKNDNGKLPNFKIGNGKNVLFMHQDVTGFRMNNFHVSGLGLDITKFKQMDKVFSGHYHLHQQKLNVVFIGAPFQTNFGERDTNKGFIVLDTNTLNWTFHEFRGAPRFKYVDYPQINRVNVNNCFVKVIIPSEIKNTEPIIEKMRSKGAISVDISTTTEELIKELEFVEELNKSTIKKLAMQFLDNIDISNDLSKKKLVSILDKINDEYLAQRA